MKTISPVPTGLWLVHRVWPSLALWAYACD